MVQIDLISFELLLVLIHLPEFFAFVVMTLVVYSMMLVEGHPFASFARPRCRQSRHGVQVVVLNLV
jgi:hypothetical protein